MMTSIFQRAKDVWKPDFLDHFVKSKSKSHKITWLFWIVSGTLIAIIWSATLAFYVHNAFPKVESGIDNAIPDGTSLSITNGVLAIEGFEQPYIIEDDEGAGSVLIIDTHKETYSQEDLDAYPAAVLVTKDGVYQKEDKVRSRHFSFSEVENFTYSKNELMTLIASARGITVFFVAVATFLVLVIALVVFRLLSALWWALILMLCAALFGMKESFVTYYFAVLNFYFIPLVIEGILLLFGIGIPFITTIIFLILFIMNLMHWKKKNEKEGLQDAPKVIEGKSLPGTVLPAD